MFYIIKNMFFTWNLNCLIVHSFLIIKYNTDKIIKFIFGKEDLEVNN